MLQENVDHDDADVAEMAVRALNAATQRARSAGYELVFVENGKLVRRDRDGSLTVLKTLPQRQVVQADSPSSHL